MRGVNALLNARFQPQVSPYRMKPISEDTGHGSAGGSLPKCDASRSSRAVTLGAWLLRRLALNYALSPEAEEANTHLYCKHSPAITIGYCILIIKMPYKSSRPRLTQ